MSEHTDGLIVELTTLQLDGIRIVEAAEVDKRIDHRNRKAEKRSERYAARELTRQAKYDPDVEIDTFARRGAR